MTGERKTGTRERERERENKTNKDRRERGITALLLHH